MADCQYQQPHQPPHTYNAAVPQDTSPSSHAIAVMSKFRPTPQPAQTASQVSPTYRVLGKKRSLLKLHQRGRIVDGTSKKELELNDKLQYLIELILQTYVNSWYPRLTPRDRSFLPHLNTIIYQVLRSLFSSLSTPHSVNQVTQLVLLRFPTILAGHVEMFWLAKGRVRTSLGEVGDLGEENGLEEVYHSLVPHRGIIPTPASTAPAPSTPPPTSHQRYHLSPLYLSLLTSHLLSTHLPATDASSTLETTLATELLARAVVGNVLRKVGNGWFWDKVFLSVLGEPGEGVKRRAERERKERAEREEREQEGGGWKRLVLHKGLVLVHAVISIALWVSSTFQSISRTYQQASPARSVKGEDEDGEEREGVFRNVLEPWVGLGGATLRIGEKGRLQQETFRFISGCLVLFGFFADRLLPYLITRLLLSPPTYTKIITKLTDVLFPDGVAAPVVPDPTEEEAEALRKRVEERVWELIPSPVRYLLLGSQPHQQRRAIQEFAEPFRNSGIMAHLEVVLVAAVAVVLMPEKGMVDVREEGEEG